MVAAVAKVRDEADVIEPVIRQMATQVDFLLVADNRSQDGTREILESLARELPLTVTEDPSSGHYQDQTITALAKQAAKHGAKWVIPFDGDEWHYSPYGRIADVLMERPEEVAIATTYDHIPSGEDDPQESDPTRRIGWRERTPFSMPKVACRTRPNLKIHIGNHAAEYDRPVDCVDGLLEIRHFKYRSPEQFVRKIGNGAKAIAMTDFPRHICDHWRRYGEILDRDGPQALERVFRERHYRENPGVDIVVDGKRRPPLILDPVALVKSVNRAR